MLQMVIIHQQPRSLFPPEITDTISCLAWRGEGNIEHTAENTCRHWTAAPQRCEGDCHIVKANGPNGFLIYFKKNSSGTHQPPPLDTYQADEDPVRSGTAAPEHDPKNAGVGP
jgi:hypothetical protein